MLIKEDSPINKMICKLSIFSTNKVELFPCFHHKLKYMYSNKFHTLTLGVTSLLCTFLQITQNHHIIATFPATYLQRERIFFFPASFLFSHIFIYFLLISQKHSSSTLIPRLVFVFTSGQDYLLPTTIHQVKTSFLVVSLRKR